MRERAVSPSRNLAMLAKLAALIPTHTRRSEEGQALQQFSTPIALGVVASTAAAITPDDLVLEPSAGTGLLAIHAELAGGKLVLNEIADIRAGLLDRLFPGAGVTRYDAAHIHDHLEVAVRPSVVLMNPPFSVAAHVDGRVADAALRHLSSALARLADGGRLVAITGASLSPDNPSWRDGFIRLQERGRLVFSAAVDGRVYARHGTTVETRLHVIDRIPADDPAMFPASAGTADDTATLLDWVTRGVPSRATSKVSATARVALPVTKRTPASPVRPNQRSTAANTIEPAGVELAYETIDWTPAETGRITDVLYEELRASVDPHSRLSGSPYPARAVRRDGLGGASQARLPAASAGPSRFRGIAFRRPARKRDLRRRGAQRLSRWRVDRRRHFRRRLRCPGRWRQCRPVSPRLVSRRRHRGRQGPPGRRHSARQLAQGPTSRPSRL
jgi:predicted RNA methylase